MKIKYTYIYTISSSIPCRYICKPYRSTIASSLYIHRNILVYTYQKSFSIYWNNVVVIKILSHNKKKHAYTFCIMRIMKHYVICVLFIVNYVETSLGIYCQHSFFTIDCIFYIILLCISHSRYCYFIIILWRDVYILYADDDDRVCLPVTVW